MKKVLMYYQDGYETGLSVLQGPRIRLIYSNGKMEWITLSTTSTNLYTTFNQFCSWTEPCYLRVPGVRKPRTAKQAIKIMKAYDLENGFPEAELIGKL